MAAVDPDRVIVWANAELERWSGVDGDRLLGSMLDEVIHLMQFDDVPVERLVETAANGTPSIHLEYEHGIRIRSQGIRSETGTIDNVVIEFQAQLRPSTSTLGKAPDDFFERIDDGTAPILPASLKALPGGPYEVELSTHSMTIAPQLIYHLGFGREDIPPAGEANPFLVERIHPDDIARLAARVLTPSENDHDVVDLRLQDAEGNYRHFRSYTFTTQRLPDGTQLHIVGFFLDLDDMMLSMEKERERTRTLESMVEASDSGVVLASPSGEITSVNTNALNMFGLAADAVVGRSIDDVLILFDARGKRVDPSFFWLSGVDERTVSNATLRVGGDKPDRKVIVEAGYMRSSSGAPSGLRFVVRTSEQELELLNRIDRGERLRALGQLAAGIAHDFNNSLTVIVGGAAMAAQAARDPQVPQDIQQSVGEYLSRVTAAADLATARTRRLLQFGNPADSGQMGPVDPHRCVRTLVDLLAEIAPREIEYQLALSATSGVQVRGAPTLETALMNLCLNSVAAGATEVVISSEDVSIVTAPEADTVLGYLEPGEYVRLSVRDNGRGIDPDLLDRVFEPFFSTTTDGNGMGLPMVYGAVTEAGGAISVKSTVGQGTQFDLFLKATTVPPKVQPTGLVQKTNDLSVILIDDDQQVRSVTASTLRSVGLTVNDFESGVDAIEWFDSNRDVDIAVVDYRMPVLDGLETIRRLREIKPELKSIMITGFLDSSTGFDDPDTTYDKLLPKPFNVDDLLLAVADVMKAPEDPTG